MKKPINNDIASAFERAYKGISDPDLIKRINRESVDERQRLRVAIKLIQERFKYLDHVWNDLHVWGAPSECYTLIAKGDQEWLVRIVIDLLLEPDTLVAYLGDCLIAEGYHREDRGEYSLIRDVVEFVAEELRDPCSYHGHCYSLDELMVMEDGYPW